MALVSDFEGFIFDYGGVLVHHQTAEDHARMAAIASVAPEKFSESYWSDRLDYDKGLVTNVQYWSDIAQKCDITLSARQIDDLSELDIESWMRFDQPMWDWIDELRRVGKRVAMLSNMPRELGEALKSRTDRLRSFDHVTLSYEVHSAKPEAVIYEECVEGIGTTPAQTLFLDDRIENVQGAEMLGIRAMQFTSRDEILLRLRP
jgi:putative hydrolase of the HAD superfamily